MAKPDTRQAQLAAVHIAQKALGLSKDDAEALKLSVTGVASAGAMTAPQRRKYLAHLSQLQATQARARGERPAHDPSRPGVQRNVADAMDARWGKARVLWQALACNGQVRTDTDAALMAYVKRQTGLEHWRFLNDAQVNTVIESLKRWCVRAGVDHRPEYASTPPGRPKAGDAPSGGSAAHEVASVGATSNA